MITHRITLPDGTEIEFFASDEALFQEKFGNFEHFKEMQNTDEFRRFTGFSKFFNEILAVFSAPASSSAIAVNVLLPLRPSPIISRNNCHS
ncbi:Uncharacterised protein [Actinobacillus indolicus]|nr:Uncharacterised protein [Actinobacillus indolicus]VTU07409.1 Uncharacterised protein [Actinobacillus indolicus]